MYPCVSFLLLPFQWCDAAASDLRVKREKKIRNTKSGGGEQEEEIKPSVVRQGHVIMWKPVVPTAANETQARAAPSARSKHAVCLDPRNNDVYVLGGRNGSIPLKDFWTFSIGKLACRPH